MGETTIEVAVALAEIIEKEADEGMPTLKTFYVVSLLITKTSIFVAVVSVFSSSISAAVSITTVSAAVSVTTVSAAISVTAVVLAVTCIPCLFVLVAVPYRHLRYHGWSLVVQGCPHGSYEIFPCRLGLVNLPLSQCLRARGDFRTDLSDELSILDVRSVFPVVLKVEVDETNSPHVELSLSILDSETIVLGLGCLFHLVTISPFQCRQQFYG